MVVCHPILRELRYNCGCMLRRAFTLIELLVVIAIIAILAAILFPVFAQAKAAAKKTACLSNLKQVGLATMMYNGAFDDLYPAWAARSNAVNGGNTRYMSPDQQISGYVKSDQIWHCPEDSKPRIPANDAQFQDGTYRSKALFRSYAYVGSVNTNEARGPDKNTGVTYPESFWDWNSFKGRADTAFDAPAETVMWVEQYATDKAVSKSDAYVGGIWGSGFIGCNTSKLAGRVVGSRLPVDTAPNGCVAEYRDWVPTTGHGGLGHYVFADGHAAAKAWSWIRDNDFYAFKVEKPR